MGNYYLTVSGDADDIVTSAIALPTSSVTPHGAGAPLSGSYITTSALSATPNSKVLGVSGGDLVISEDSGSVTLESAFTSGTVRSLVLTGGTYTDLSAVKLCATASGALLLTDNHSVGSPQACPVPNPYVWIMMDSDGTDSQANVDFGAGGTVTGASSTGDTYWDQGNNKLMVSATGVYRVLTTGIITVAGNTAVELRLYINGVLTHTSSAYVHGVSDPDIVTLDWVGFVEGGDNVRVTRDPTSAQNAKFTTNSTMTVTRLA